MFYLGFTLFLSRSASSSSRSLFCLRRSALSLSRLTFFLRSALYLSRSTFSLSRFTFSLSRSAFSLSTSTFHPGKPMFCHHTAIFHLSKQAMHPHQHFRQGRLLPPLENMAPSPPLLLCALLEVAMVNLAANAVAGGLDSRWLHQSRHCPCPCRHCPHSRATAPSWTPSGSRGRDLEGPPDPSPRPRHYQRYKIELLLFATTCWQQTRHVGNTAWEAGGSPPRLSSWLGGTRAPQRRPCWPLAGWGGETEIKKKPTLFFDKILI